MTDPTIREALTSAFDKHEADAPEAAAPEVAAVETPDPAAAASETPPSSQGEASSPEAAAGDPKVAAPASSPAATGAPVSPPAVAPKAPRSWSAEAKAEFSKLPPAVQNDVLRREREISQGLERTAPARQHFERFSEVTRPFEPLLQAYGVDAIDATRTLFATRAALEIGTPEQKAQIVANIIHDFGLDVEKVDQAIMSRNGGRVMPFQQAPVPPQRNLLDDPSLAPIKALVEQVKQANVARAEAEVSKVESLPHFDELREDMADIVETFHAAGKPITIEAAYKRALAMNPDLDPAVASTPTISKSQAAAILASRNAASSIAGSPRTGAEPAPTDRRSQIAAAYDRVSAR